MGELLGRRGWRRSVGAILCALAVVGVGGAVALMAAGGTSGSGALQEPHTASSRSSSFPKLTPLPSDPTTVPASSVAPATSLTTKPTTLRGRLACPGASRAGQWPMVTVLGAAGTFGLLSGGTTRTPAVPTPCPISGWHVGPGQAFFVSAISSDRTVVIATQPQSLNPVAPTATDMELVFFDPTKLKLKTERVSTTAGQLTATQPGLPVGGADVADVVALRGNRIAFASTEPWHGWDLPTTGQFPTVGVSRRSSAGWVLKGAWTGDQLNTSSPGSCGPSGPTAGCGIAALGVLPGSGALVAGQYFGDPSAGSRSGGIVALSQAGHVLTRFVYPNASIFGRAVTINPREIDVDPTGRVGDERFAVVFDVFGPGPFGYPSTVQEFRFDGKSITPLSASIIPGSGNLSNPLSVGVATYDHQGNLWISLVHAGTFNSAGLAVYSRTDRTAVLDTRCAARGDWANFQWGRPCPPSSTFAVGGGAVLSLMVDQVTSAVLAANASGQLTSLVPDGHGHWHLRPPLELGANFLVDRRNEQLSIRRGVVDTSARVLWIPIGQLTPLSSLWRWPTPPVERAQWLVRVDLRQLLGH